MANIIFLDWPVGAGFSYATTPEGYHTSDSESPEDIYAFLRKVSKSTYIIIHIGLIYLHWLLIAFKFD